MIKNKPIKSGSQTNPEADLNLEKNLGEAKPSLSRDSQFKIGQQLRAMYDEVIDQGVPNRFVELLNRLDQHHDAVKKK